MDLPKGLVLEPMTSIAALVDENFLCRQIQKHRCGMELKTNQAALLLEIDEDEAITVNVDALDMDSLAAQICIAIAKKLINDEKFQAELMDMIDAADDE